MRTTLKASDNNWITQSDSHPGKASRIFAKSLPVNHPEWWTEWTTEAKDEYEKDHPKGKEAYMLFIKSCINVSKLMKEAQEDPSLISNINTGEILK